MSLQSDLELCLEYAERLEEKREQCTQAQNKIIFINNESERLKKRIKICTTLVTVAVIGLLLIAAIMFAFGLKETADLFSGVLALSVMLIISFYIGNKAKKESLDLEAKKGYLIQQYTQEAEDSQRDLARLIEEIYREDLLDIVPPDYFSVAAIEFCLTQVRKKIATTATEAFRLLEAEIKRLEQIELLEQMNDAQAEQLEDIKRAIQINTLVTMNSQYKK